MSARRAPISLVQQTTDTEKGSLVKVAAKYTGCVLTDRVMQVHFALTVGGHIKRAAHVKVPLTEFTEAVWATAMDRASRRRLVEIWSDEPLPPWTE